MEKLTLRQFADVIKALVEADMPKEAGFTLKVVESGDKEKADGQKVELVCTKEEKKEDTKKTDSVEAYSSEYCSAEITYDMNADYREYELELVGSAAPQDEILRKIAKRVVYDIVGRVIYDIDGDSKVEKKEAEKVEEKKEDCECQEKDKDDFADDFDDDDLDDDWADDENTCECCGKALKAALIDAAVDVMLSAKHGKAKGQRAEITVKTKSSVVRAEVTDEDLYRAINSAVDVVTGRLKKIKEKSRKRAGSDSIRAMEREREDDAVIKEEFEVGADEIDEFEVNGGISREKIVSAESMTRDEACVEMEFTDHDFYVFKDAERDDMLCVIYRREAGGYGLLAVPETV